MEGRVAAFPVAAPGARRAPSGSSPESEAAETSPTCTNLDVAMLRMDVIHAARAYARARAKKETT